jgi:hypothetical protein
MLAPIAVCLERANLGDTIYIASSRTIAYLFGISLTCSKIDSFNFAKFLKFAETQGGLLKCGIVPKYDAHLYP